MRTVVASLVFGMVAGCAPGRGVVQVTLDSDIPLSGITHLGVDIENNGQSTHVDANPSAAIALPPVQTFDIAFDKDRKGPIHVTVEAFDPQGVSLGKGSGDGDVEPSQDSTVYVKLIHGIHHGDMAGVDMPIDASGVTDMEMPDIAIPPDLTLIPDLTFVCHSDNDCIGMKDNPTCNGITNKCVPCIATDGDAGTMDSCKMSGLVCTPVNGVLGCHHGCNVDGDCPTMTDGGAPLLATTCCNHLCVDVTSDSASCGACNKACAGKQECCGSTCIDTATDVKNCSGCGTACVVNNDTAACMNSVCTISMCSSGYKDCNNDPKDGCEINATNDLNHCGMCGNKCMGGNATWTCSGGACMVAMCLPNFSDCNKDPKDGCEVATGTDISHCGTCMTVCMVSNGAPNCSGGACGVANCLPGFADCNKSYGDGCEVNLNSDVKNCGMCNAQCAIANGTPGCGGMPPKCAVAGCNMGFADCDGSAVNGCEINTTNNPANCGGCGKPCMKFNNTPGCSNSTCTSGICDAGFFDCDNNPANGCEINLTNDVNNCGACNKTCTAGQVCSSSKCLDQVLIVGTDSLGGAGLADVKAKLVGTNTFSKVEIFDAGNATPTLQQLTPYSALLAYSDPSNPFADPKGTGDALGSFLELGQGRRVVVAAMADYKLTPLQGKITTYMLLDTGGSSVNSPNDFINMGNNKNLPIFSGINSISAIAPALSSSNTANGGSQLASWNGAQRPFVVVGMVNIKGSQVNRVDLNFFPPSRDTPGCATCWTGNGAELLRNALIYK